MELSAYAGPRDSRELHMPAAAAAAAPSASDGTGFALYPTRWRVPPARPAAPMRLSPLQGLRGRVLTGFRRRAGGSSACGHSTAPLGFTSSSSPRCSGFELFQELFQELASSLFVATDQSIVTSSVPLLPSPPPRGSPSR